jgi:hypothetical protein
MRGIFLVVDAGELKADSIEAEKEYLFGFDCIVLWRFSIYLLGYHQYGMSEQETRLTLELQNAEQVNSLPSSKRILLTKVQMNP